MGNLTHALEVKHVQACLLVRTFKWTLQQNFVESFPDYKLCVIIYEFILSDTLNLQNGIKGQTNDELEYETVTGFVFRESMLNEFL